ncbi:uncharacterized protein LOC128240798 isoform X3 [Mya arenaria]|uniref:uncharacterized protein LOC128240798 isoform X3 n=1 Tax=Mya arenaria TaxID=6604 RepID=UPI0022DF5F2E|nr:uncharacterized protein LOC128240798 isoform X3 [Mya arenaria]
MACSSEDGEQNHAKLMQLHDPCSNTLKALLEFEMLKTVTPIDQLLLKNKKQISRKVGQTAKDLLFPKGNQPTNVDAWDISLFCCILRICCMLQPTQDNDVNAVRITRNEIAHSPKPCISNADYAKHANVFKTFITNTLNYINDQDLKAEINEQVQEAERPVSKQVIRAFITSHKSYHAIADEVKEHIDEKHEIVMQEFQDFKRFISTLPKDWQSKLKPPDLASFKLLVKECSPDEEKKISQILVRIFGEELGKKCSTLSDDTCKELKDVVGILVKRLREKADLIDAEYGCVCIFTRFYDFSSYMDFLDYLMNGKLTEAALPLQSALRCCFGIESLQVELVMEDEQFLHCFLNTLDCVKNVCSALRTVTRDIDQDAPDTDVPDIIMSTFNTELEKNSDLTLSKNDADKYGQVLKDAIKVLIAGNSQKQATAVRTEQEINRLTKDYNKTEEESISTTGENEMQSNLGEAEVIRSPKQCAESVDRLMLCKGKVSDVEEWSLEKADDLVIISNEQSFGNIDKVLLHQGTTGRVQLPALEKGEAAEGHLIQESTHSVDEDLLPKDSKILPGMDLELSSQGKADDFRSTKQNEESKTQLQKDPPSDQNQLLPVEAGEEEEITRVTKQFFEPVDATRSPHEYGHYQSLPIEAEEEIIRVTKQSFESVDEALLPLGLCLDKVSKGSVIFKCKPTRPEALETLTSFCNYGRIKEVIPAFFRVPTALENLPKEGFVQRLTIYAAFIDYEKERNLQDVTLKFQRYSENEAEKEQKDPKIKTRMSDKTLRSTELIYQGIVRFTIEDKELKVQTFMPLVRSDQDLIWRGGMNEIRRPVDARIERKKCFEDFGVQTVMRVGGMNARRRLLDLYIESEKCFIEFVPCIIPDVVNEGLYMALASLKFEECPDCCVCETNTIAKRRKEKKITMWEWNQKNEDLIRRKEKKITMWEWNQRNEDLIRRKEKKITMWEWNQRNEGSWMSGILEILSVWWEQATVKKAEVEKEARILERPRRRSWIWGILGNLRVWRD